MLGTEIAMPEPLRLLPSKVQDLMGRLGELAEQLAAARTGTLHPATLPW
jgi:hypothetical protein